MTLFECQKCGAVSDTEAKTPRCLDRDCSSPRLRILSNDEAAAWKEAKKDIKIESNDMETMARDVFELVKDKTKKIDSMDEFDLVLIEHAKRLSRIQLLHAMTYGGHTPETQRDANTAMARIVDSLRDSNESLVESIAAASTEQAAAETGLVQQQNDAKNDPIQQILKFAAENPDSVKEFLSQFKKSDATG